MSDRIDLSADTWIETMDDVRYLVTKSRDVGVGWIDNPSVEHRVTTTLAHGSWYRADQIFETRDPLEWFEIRILLTACWEIYRYREGERFITPSRTTDAMFLSIDSSSYRNYDKLHGRAANVCDTAEQFRAFYDAIKPEGDNG